MLRGVASGQPSTEDATTHPEPIRVRGFVREGVSFGGATAFLATLHHDGRSTDVAVLIPDLSRHVDVMEIIAGDFLREAFHLSDGDEVSIHLIMPMESAHASMTRRSSSARRRQGCQASVPPS